MIKIQSTKSNFAYNILLTISNFLFPLISFPYISRIIGPQGIGKVQFLTTFAQYFVLIAALGIPIYGVREVAKLSGDRNAFSKLFSELFIINVISSLVMLACYLAIVLTFSRFSNELDFYLIAGLLVLFGFTSIDWFYSGLQEFRFITIRSVIIKIIALVGLFLFVKTESNVRTYLYITIFSIIGNNIWNLFHLHNTVDFHMRELRLKRHLSILITLFSTSISTSIYTVMDTLLLGFFTDDKTVGYYTASIKLNKIAIPLIVSLGVVLMPQISKSIAAGTKTLTQNLIDKSFAFICIIGIPISIGLCVTAPEIMRIFSGKEFIPATFTMQIASPLVFFIGLGHVFGLQILVPSNHEKYYLFATICGMIVSLVVNVILIHIIQDKGAAVATVLGEFVVSAVSYHYITTKLSYKFEWSLVLKSIASCIIFIPIAVVNRMCFGNDFIVLVISAMLSFCSYFMIQLFVFRDKMSLEIIKIFSAKIGLK
ncbi:flippase [Pedobacter sp. P26]|uniref:flippase n=1 Tax=Pedobacter sp. P26 TaxID=3423956 RepID=UPI003D67D07B